MNDKSNQNNKNDTQTWSADHGGGVSPPTSPGTLDEEQVHEPSNDWPAAEGVEHDPVEPVPSPVDEFEPPQNNGRRTFQNGDTDRS